MRERLIEWLVVLSVVILGIGLVFTFTGCAINKYDEDGNLVEQITPPSVDELAAYAQLVQQLEPLFTRVLRGETTQEDEDTIDKLLAYYNSPEGQEALDRANERTRIMIDTLRELRKGQQ